MKIDELIALLESGSERGNEYDDDLMHKAAETIRVLNAIPAADVRPVVHARWLDGYRRQLCSICCYKGMRSWRFCPQCGAMMDADMREVQDG